jgi:type 1 glutamine amidotransferase
MIATFVRYVAPFVLLLSCSSGQANVPGAPALKVVLVAGGPSHGPGEHEYYAGSMILARLLRQTPDIDPVVVRDGWPADPTIFEGAASIVFFTDGNVWHPLLVADRMDVLGTYLARGAGFICLHWAVHFPESASVRVLGWLGGHYSDDISVNPVWLASFQNLPAHPVLRGVAPFEVEDEWYYNMRFVTGVSSVSPLLSAVPPDDTRFTADAAMHPGRAETVAWAYERDGGGRSFGFTGAHYHKNWGVESFRRAVVNAILWTAHRDVPEGGAPVTFDPAWLDENLDPK